MTLQRSALSVLLLIGLLIPLSGCRSLDEALARAEQLATQARTAQTEAHATLDKLEALSVSIKEATAHLSEADAQRVTEGVNHALEQARAGMAQIDTAVNVTAGAVEVAAKAKAAGETWFSIAIGLLGIAGPGGVAAAKIISGLRTAVEVRDKAIVATAEHADRMENATDDKDIAVQKLISVAQQKALGVDALIEKLRGG